MLITGYPTEPSEKSMDPPWMCLSIAWHRHIYILRYIHTYNNHKNTYRPESTQIKSLNRIHGELHGCMDIFQLTRTPSEIVNCLPTFLGQYCQYFQYLDLFGLFIIA